jgi:hypothetical protein
VIFRLFNQKFVDGLVDWLWDCTRHPLAEVNVAIFATRYGGAYEGAPWVAVVTNENVGQFRSPLDEGWAGDNTANDFWRELDDAPVGRGATPTLAHEDLKRIAKIGRDAYQIERREAREERTRELNALKDTP